MLISKKPIPSYKKECPQREAPSGSSQDTKKVSKDDCSVTEITSLLYFPNKEAWNNG